MTPPTNAVVAALHRAAPGSRVMTSPAQMAGYESDGLGYKSFRPDLVVIPPDADELARVVRVLHDARVPICLRGAGTSLSGGPVAAQGGVIVHTSKLRAIREISQDGLWCEVESGVNLRQLDEALQPSGLC
ncbi:MAG: FAD-binding oxidoreductase, partial [Verrucomicrobiota bacterium]